MLKQFKLLFKHLLFLCVFMNIHVSVLILIEMLPGSMSKVSKPRRVLRSPLSFIVNPNMLNNGQSLIIRELKIIY